MRGAALLVTRSSRLQAEGLATVGAEAVPLEEVGVVDSELHILGCDQKGRRGEGSGRRSEGKLVAVCNTVYSSHSDSTTGTLELPPVQTCSYFAQ